LTFPAEHHPHVHSAASRPRRARPRATRRSRPPRRPHPPRRGRRHSVGLRPRLGR